MMKLASPDGMRFGGLAETPHSKLFYFYDFDKFAVL